MRLQLAHLLGSTKGYLPTNKRPGRIQLAKSEKAVACS